MSERPPNQIVPTEGSGPGGGNFFQDLVLRVKLILRLMGDRRVSPLLKLLPLGSIAYVFVPDLLPGPIDDAAMTWFLAYLFVELAPQEVVQEHLRRLTSVVEGQWREIDEGEGPRDKGS
ncbi:MAG TPA: hypothetical protein VJJ46_08335 [Anaerolineales bacterium]|nr:hypothetical protein [Anaerolineales bacterium]